MTEKIHTAHRGKVLLVSLNAKYIHSNLAIRYLENYYLEHAYKKCPIELQKAEYTINQHASDIAANIYEMKADIVGFSCYIWNIEMIFKIVKNLKKVAPNIKIILGGPEVSFDSNNLLLQYPEIDYIICGEGEYAFAEVICYELQGHHQEKYQKNLDYFLPNNVSYRVSSAKEIRPATEQGRIKDLSNILSPYEQGFDSEQYKHRIIYYETSRGCPYSCQYCLSSTDQGVRFFPIDRVKRDLLKFIAAEVKQVKFVDRTFNCAPKYAMELFTWIIDNQQGKTNFHFEISADLLTDDMIEFLQKAPQGLFQFEIGVQSTHERTLTEIQRTTNFEKLKRAVEEIHAGGNIHQHLDLIVGLPYEGYQQFAKSFNDVYELQPDKLQMGFLKALKGSGIRARERDYGLVYTSEPPYEVLMTSVLSYKEIIKLKEIEHTLDHYYNSHQFDQSLKLLIKTLNTKPFDFYEQFADYCKEVGVFERAHSQGSMYNTLYGFSKRCLEESKIEPSACNEVFLLRIQETLKFDFIRLSPHGKIPDFIMEFQPEGFKKRKQAMLSNPDIVQKYFPQYAELNMRNLSKRVHIEVFQYDIMGNKEEQVSYYMFVYHDDPLQFKRADWYDITTYFNE
ncbi:B12-binding domain-containing radical SAM protein [Desulfuribacillus alkaliarsenatis]|uniref:Uncharacterized protein n=1 Tax=Desulfuribacillus alkaliarsenatis TaxID=766136 RepID=A0A1E5G506_9FIRM|nr:B12-binding domain-containing radical SAM protein [Desulfuribacillus alkaliarsenatis]OEF98199.1 hypothetical protein BHF68_00480 [Desulfuribacillus alkaliarsenatis]